jgi:hypothetical protein
MPYYNWEIVLALSILIPEVLPHVIAMKTGIRGED